MSDLSEGRKLTWLGAKRANNDENVIKPEVSRLKQNTSDYQEYQDAVNSIGNFSQHESWLTNNGFPSADAELFTEKIQDSVGGWSAWESYILVQTDSYETMKNAFPTEVTFGGIETTSDGEVAAGIRIHDSDGISKNGIPISAGTVELFGTRLEVSQTGDPDVTEDEVVYSNLTVSNTSPAVNETFTVSVDIENQNRVPITAYPQLTINGVVEEQRTVTIDDFETVTVEYQYAHPIPGTLRVDIENTNETDVRVNAEQL